MMLILNVIGIALYVNLHELARSHAQKSVKAKTLAVKRRANFISYNVHVFSL